MDDEEIVLLEEQLAGAHADIERLQSRLADAEARATDLQSEAESTRQQLAGVQSQLEEERGLARARAEEIGDLQSALSGACSSATAAVERYRELALEREPELPAELVAGDSVGAVDESLVRARETVARVRQHLEQQAHALRVPPGAPARSGPDFSGLSPAEKIRLGLET